MNRAKPSFKKYVSPKKEECKQESACSEENDVMDILLQFSDEFKSINKKVENAHYHNVMMLNFIFF